MLTLPSKVTNGRTNCFARPMLPDHCAIARCYGPLVCPPSAPLNMFAWRGYLRGGFARNALDALELVSSGGRLSHLARLPQGAACRRGLLRSGNLVGSRWGRARWSPCQLSVTTRLLRSGSDTIRGAHLAVSLAAMNPRPLATPFVRLALCFRVACPTP